MFQNLFLFEWRFHTRQIAFIVAALILTLVGAKTGLQSLGGANVFIDAPYNIIYTMGITSLGGIFVVTLFSVAAIMRDHEHQMDQIIHATPVDRLSFLASRFLGSFAAAFTVFCCIAGGMIVARLLPIVEPERLNAFDPGAYFWGLLVMAMPNIFFCASILFAVAALTRKALPTYVSGIMLYILYFLVSALLDSPILAGSAPSTPQGLALGAVLDPFGINAFYEQTRYWTISERNTTYLALKGNFLWNRLLWTTVSVVLLGMVYRFYDFGMRHRSARKKDTAEETTQHFRVVKRQPQTGRHFHLSTFRTMMSLNLKGITRSYLFWGVQLIWISMLLIEMGNGLKNASGGTSSIPTTGILLPAMSEGITLLSTLIILFFGSELVFRERTTGIGFLMDATPTKAFTFYAAKLCSVISLAAITLATGFAGVLLVQIRGDWFQQVQWDLFPAYTWFYGMPMVLVSVLIVFVQSLFTNKYLGLSASVVITVFFHRGAFGLLEHNLLRYAGSPLITYSEMNGFGDYATPFNWFMAYWLAFAVLLGLLTLGLWQRGTDNTLRHRFSNLWLRWGMAGRLSAGVALAVFLLCGGYIYDNTNVRNSYTSRDKILDNRAAYERAFSNREGHPAPVIVDADLKVDLFPNERRATVRATYQLANNTDEPIQEIMLHLDDTLDIQGIQMDRAELTDYQPRFGLRHYVMSTPLRPGGRVQLQVDVGIINQGFTNNSPDNAVVANGSFLTFTRFAPALGYRVRREIQDNFERRKRGLEPKKRKTLHDWDAEHDEILTGRFTYQAVVSTHADQIPLAPGRQLRAWEENGRRYAHFQTVDAVIGHLGFMSAAYAVEKVNHNGISLEVYYHPAHDYNVSYMIKAARRSLDIFSKSFGAYPYDHLRIFEIPGHWSNFSGIGFPGTVGLLENRAFLADRRNPDEMDQILRRVAHEVAHQWWGRMIDPAFAPGASMLIESLTKYSEMLVLEDMYGTQALQPYLIHAMDRYLRGRTTTVEEETALYQAQSPFLVYHKGAVIMHGLRELLGKDMVNRCLSRMLHKPDLLTTDLLAEFKKEAPEEHHHLIDLWFTKIGIYDLSVASAETTQLPNGRYQVDMVVRAKLFEADGKGVEQPISINQNIPVGIFTGAPDNPNTRVLYLQDQHITAEETKLSIIVPEEPSRVGIDPYIRMIDRNRFDNLKTPSKKP